LSLPVRHGRTAKKIDATAIPNESNTPFPSTPNRTVIKANGKKETGTTLKKIRIINGLTSEPNITASRVTTVIIDIRRITSTLISIGVIINAAIIFISGLKNTNVISINALFTAAQTGTCRFWLQHLNMAGR
jgi:hypothetical protein